MKKLHILLLTLALAALALVSPQTGLAQTYSYSYSGQLQQVTLPAGAYDITAYGAQGGNGGGLGAQAEAWFTFDKEVTLTLLVGGAGGNGYSGGGGGGSFVAFDSSNPLLVAGGGGGSSIGGPGQDGSDGGGSGSGGNTRDTSSGGASGGGFFGDGLDNDVARGGGSFLSGGSGGWGWGGEGGFGGGGGGGGGSGGGMPKGGGGGGYTGGDGGYDAGYSEATPATGGNSFVSDYYFVYGSNIQLSGVQSGNGKITIQLMSTNAALAELALYSDGQLTPEFASNVFFYRANVTDSMVALVPTTAQSDATISVNGTDWSLDWTSATPCMINLNFGTNTFNVVVTAQDRSTVQTYTVQVVRYTGLATVTWGNLLQTYDGTAKSVSMTTSPKGLACAVTYDGDTNAPVNAGSYNVIATVTEPGYLGMATNTLVIDKASQDITFGTLPLFVEGDAPCPLSATASSGLPMSYASSDSKVAEVEGGLLAIMGLGSANISASQPGSSNYLAASNVVQLAVVTNLVAQLAIGTDNFYTNVALIITGNPDRQYNIQYLDDLSQVNWQTLTVISNLPSASYRITYPVTNTVRFYRLQRPVWTPGRR